MVVLLINEFFIFKADNFRHGLVRTFGICMNTLRICLLGLFSCLTLLACGGGSGSTNVADASGVITVRNSVELTNALAAVTSGQTIQLAAGTYAGNFRIANKNGTEASPIYIKGTNAVLSSPSISTGYGLQLDGVSYVVIDGIEIVGSQKGLVVDASSHCTLQKLTISGSGMEGVHFRKSSSFNILQDSRIHSTGLYDAANGEGVYLGSAYSNWSKYMANADTPDASNDNLILRNFIGPKVSAEAVDVKEGTKRNRIELNYLNSTGTSAVDSTVDIKGDSTLIIDNTLVHTPTLVANFIVDGMQSHAITVAGIIYGQGNLFSGNSIDVNTTFGTADFITLPATGYAIKMFGGATGTVCTSNQAQHGVTLTNVSTVVCP